MKVLVLYRPQSDHRRVVEEFIENYKSRNHVDNIEGIDIDSREGSDMATLYDIVRYPAIMVIQDDGNMQKLWEGEELPLIDEVLSYARM